VQQRTRSLAWKTKNTRVSHREDNRITRHSRTRMVLTVSFALFPVIGLFVTVIGGLVRRFNASVEASEPHDFAVRFGCARLAPPKRPPHPAPNVRDDRETPLV
jgi:hypothetical protein